MHQKIKDHLDQMITNYTTDDYQEIILEAKKSYFELTGALAEDDADFEAKMSCFSDWYLFHFVPKAGTTTILNDYLSKQSLDNEIVDGLKAIQYSLFEFTKESLKKQIVLTDFVHNKKIVLASDQAPIGIVPGDIFTGRIITFNQADYLLDGICLFPSEVKKIFKKEAKKVRKLKDPEAELPFLYHLESLKTKWVHYGHIDSSKIFTFEK